MYLGKILNKLFFMQVYIKCVESLETVIYFVIFNTFIILVNFRNLGQLSLFLIYS